MSKDPIKLFSHGIIGFLIWAVVDTFTVKIDQYVFFEKQNVSNADNQRLDRKTNYRSQDLIAHSYAFISLALWSSEKIPKILCCFIIIFYYVQWL